MNLYVYYDVATDTAAALARAVRAMQDDLRDAAGSAPRLMKRVRSDAACETWMEVYEGVDAAFESRLERAVARVDWRDAGPRHVERFVDC